MITKDLIDFELKGVGFNQREDYLLAGVMNTMMVAHSAHIAVAGLETQQSGLKEFSPDKYDPAKSAVRYKLLSLAIGFQRKVRRAQLKRLLIEAERYLVYSEQEEGETEKVGGEASGMAPLIRQHISGCRTEIGEPCNCGLNQDSGMASMHEVQQGANPNSPPQGP